jgi:hypothetical protein
VCGLFVMNRKPHSESPTLGELITRITRNVFSWLAEWITPQLIVVDPEKIFAAWPMDSDRGETPIHARKLKDYYFLFALLCTTSVRKSVLVGYSRLGTHRRIMTAMKACRGRITHSSHTQRSLDLAPGNIPKLRPKDILELTDIT